MDLCDDGHQQVAYEGRSCPFCDLIYKKDKEITELEKKIEDLEEKIVDMGGAL